jgi:hypothetical protein
MSNYEAATERARTSSAHESEQAKSPIHGTPTRGSRSSLRDEQEDGTRTAWVGVFITGARAL